MESSINLTVVAKEGRSYIKSLYVTPPFRVVSVGQLRRDGAAYLMQMSTSPGILSGDRYTLDINVESGARLQLASQSYQRLYDMEGEASQEMSITIGDDAHYSQVPHPIVPHRNSAFHSRTTVKMGEGSTFLQSEIITCGRKFHGEEFLFRTFSNSVELYDHSGMLRLKDRVWLAPGEMPLSDCGLLEGWSHQGTLIFQSTQQIDIKAIIEDLYADLSANDKLHCGISATHYPGFVIRVLGSGGEQIYNLFTSIQEYMWKFALLDKQLK